MAQQKADGVIEAVRYDDNGLLSLIRVFERRGPTYSDQILITRDDLLKVLRTGKKYYVGKRINLQSSTFTLDRQVCLSGKSGQELIGTQAGQQVRDDLPEAPLF